MGTHLRKTVAASAIAGAAVGFGAFALAPTASADTASDNTGWWLGSGNASNNNTIIGQAGAGNSNQFGNFNGNVMNNQQWFLNLTGKIAAERSTNLDLPHYESAAPIA